MTRRRRVRAQRRLLALAALSLLWPMRLAAQQSCAPTNRTASAARAWPAPLDRKGSLPAGELTLRQALERLAASTGLRFSYTAELLPLDRLVCVDFRAAAAGDILSEVLRGLSVEPIAAGRDQVVLAPARAARVRPDSSPPHPVVELDRVVVTGSATAARQRPLSVALSVIEGESLERAGASTLSEIIAGAVPGMWAWSQSPTSLLVRYGSIRGASSFSVSYPKVYIDGIQVANPLIVARFTPEAVERIEVIRGPQGAALYGTDAISGVINIVTRHESAEDGAARFRIRSGLGRSESDFVAGGPLTQEHALAFRAGTAARSAGLTLAAGGMGEFIPGGSSRHLSADGNGRLFRGRTMLTGTLRLLGEQAGAPISPVLRDSVPAPSTTLAARLLTAAPEQSLWQYTAGATAAFMASPTWTHSAVLGLDGYALDDVADDLAPVPFSADSALRASAGAALRGTMRVSSVALLSGGDDAAATVTLAAEHSVLRERAPDEGVTDMQTMRPVPVVDLVDWRSNSGLVAQASASLRDQLYLTGGLRLEHNDGLATADRWALLPMVGAALVRDRGRASVKLRAAYGKGIRPPEVPTRETVWAGLRGHARRTALDPEEQSGVEAGVEVSLGRAVAFQVTRFDQVASGLIQRVVVSVDAPALPGRPAQRHLVFQLQNVGEVTNRGWEMQGSASRDRFSLTAAYSSVDSRVRALARGYSGDLRPGDRMLEVPARTLSLTAGWSAERGSASLTAYRAFDWVNYDRVALTRAFLDTRRPARDLMGPLLRAFWRDYDGVTRLRSTVTVGLRPGLTLLATGDNLLDRQRGEPDNVTVLPGRTVTLGVRVEH